MSNAIHTYVKDRAGLDTLSAYAMPESYLTFYVDADELKNSAVSNRRVLWDFGDGNVSESLTATHAYNLPGSYEVVLYSYDGAGNAIDSSDIKIITAKNIINDSIILAAPSATSMHCSSKSYVLTAIGAFSWQSDSSRYTFTCDVRNIPEGWQYANHPDFVEDKWNHIKPSYGFFVTGSNGTITPTDTFDFSTRPIYAEYNSTSNAYDLSHVSGANSIFVGSSGATSFLFVNDYAFTNNTSAAITLDVDMSTIQRGISFVYPYKDYIPEDVVINIQSPNILIPSTYTDYNKIIMTITSNGMDSEFASLSSYSPFALDVNKFEQYPVSFVIKIKNGETYETILEPEVARSYLSIIDLKFLDNNNVDITESLVGDTMKLGFLGSAISGIFVPQINTYSGLTGNINPGFSCTNVSGISSPFNVYPSGGVYNFMKVNENIDMVDVYKALTFVENIRSNDELFDTFFANIVGTIYDNPDALGKRVYEKTANFPSNMSDIDTCNVDSLRSAMAMFDISENTYNFMYPAEVKRLLDTLSIKMTKLWGSRNVFAENFRFYANTNLGDRIDPSTYMVSAKDANNNSGIIVSYEKFSEKFCALNTDIPDEVLYPYAASGYPISGYNLDWGWNLALPSGYAPEDIFKFYDFYQYKPNTDQGELIEGVIVWPLAETPELSANYLQESEKNYQKWVDDKGIVDNMFNHQILKGIKLGLGDIPADFIKVDVLPCSSTDMPTDLSGNALILPICVSDECSGCI